MTELLTAAQMRAIERAAIESGEVTGLELMERAGRGTLEAILAEWPELASGERRAVVLCGPGNNGGDGFVVARLLRERGWAVEVFLYGDAEKLPPDARVNYDRWCSSRSVRTWNLEASSLTDLAPDMIIDALFGTGLRRGPHELLCRTYRDVQTCRYGEGLRGKVVSIDIPSGICSDSGRPIENCSGEADAMALPLQVHVEADLTTTFHAQKVGHVISKGADAAGKVEVVSLGPPLNEGWNAKRWLCEFHGMPTRGRGLRVGQIVARWVHPYPTSMSDLTKAGGHKYDHGHALILSGGVGRGGAARMAARGALRIGAGLVTLGCPPAAVIENAAQLDAIMLRPVRDGDALAAMLEDGRLNALCLGPGLGTEEREAALVRAALGGASGDGPGMGDEEEQRAPGSTRGLDRQAPTADERGATDRGPGSEAGARSGEAGALSDGDRRDAGPEADGGAGLDAQAPSGGGPGSGAGAPGDGGGGLAQRVTKRGPAVVLDGDALTILSREPDLFALLHDRCVLTPHGGEFARLFPDIAERLDAPAETGPAYSKVDAARDAAARAGCVVVFKGPDTVIADPQGRAAVNSAHYERAVPWLATAGAGDVLAGFVTGLLARGLGPMQAAEAAAWLHVECALEFGPGLIAEDLPEQLPKVFRRLGV